MTISEKVAYLKGLAEGLDLDTEKSKEGKLISVMIGILEEIGLSLEDLEGIFGIGDLGHGLQLADNAADLFSACDIAPVDTVRDIAGLGTRNAAKGCVTLPHNNDFLLDEDALEYGSRIFVRFVLDHMKGL